MQRVVENLIKELNVESMLRSGKKRDEKMEKIESDLVRVRELIKEAIVNSRNSTLFVEDEDYVPKGQIYRNPYVFQRYLFLFFKDHKLIIMLCLIVISFLYSLVEHPWSFNMFFPKICTGICLLR